MSTLLLRLAAPLQAWGAESKFERRATGREPTKSGVIGLLAAALGRRRSEPLDDLARLKFGVRIDRPGQVMMDFHMAHSMKQAYVTKRYYLEDAVFVVGLEGDTEFLRILESALNAPFFPLFLGRRSCPPTGQVCMGIRMASLKDALISEPLSVSRKNGEAEDIMLTLNTDTVGDYRQRDFPISFSQQHRKFAYRYLETHIAKHDKAHAEVNVTEHDAYEGVNE